MESKPQSDAKVDLAQLPRRTGIDAIHDRQGQVENVQIAEFKAQAKLEKALSMGRLDGHGNGGKEHKVP